MNKAMQNLLAAAQEAAEHERAFWDARDQDDTHREPTWLAELEAAIREAKEDIANEA